MSLILRDVEQVYTRTEDELLEDGRLNKNTVLDVLREY